ncbi:MAG TPA: acyloxyacyl hydrolase [Granulicella sp.]|jgi:lipid A 3-O-deacylase|nr:acyloxyacyl hydrolase [Granulicella sp.]
MKFVPYRSGFRLLFAVVLAGMVAVPNGRAQIVGPSSSSSSMISSATFVSSADSAAAAGVSGPQAPAATAETPFRTASTKLPFEFGALVQGGLGLTEDRNNFKFMMAGVHAGKVLYKNNVQGKWRGNFEYAVELFPYWQSFTPTMQRANCTAIPNSTNINCSPLYTVGGTYSGVSVTPIILRWNFAGTKRISPWVQGAGGLIWTNHKYPAFGSTILNLANDGPNTDTSVWNFTPQFGVGFHYFIRPRRSIDFSANAVHISSASLGDKNPGVNASVQFSVGYTFWK